MTRICQTRTKISRLKCACRLQRRRPFERSWQWSSLERSWLTEPREARAMVSYSLGLYPIYYACSASTLPSMTLVALHIRPRRSTRLRNRVCRTVHEIAIAEARASRSYFFAILISCWICKNCTFTLCGRPSSFVPFLLALRYATHSASRSLHPLSGSTAQVVLFRAKAEIKQKGIRVWDNLSSQTRGNFREYGRRTPCGC